MTENFLELKNIGVNLPGTKKKIFQELNLALPKETSIVGLLGSNGSGKTLLAKMIMGLIKIKSGKIILFGNDITKIKTTKRLDSVSLSFQMINMSFLKHSVSEEFAYNQDLLFKRKETQNIESKLPIEIENFNTSKKNQHPLTLSGGEKRKLSFYLLRMNDPEMYILDEPTVGLDQYGINELLKDLQGLVNLGKKILIITHNLQFLMKLTDNVLILTKDEKTQISSLHYQGSLTSYLLTKKDEAKSFLTIPIEFEIYQEQLSTNKLQKSIDYQSFLKMDT